MSNHPAPLPAALDGPAEKGPILGEPVGWRELVGMGAIDSQTREIITRWLLMQMEAGENDPEKLKALVIDRFSRRS